MHGPYFRRAITKTSFDHPSEDQHEFATAGLAD